MNRVYRHRQKRWWLFIVFCIVAFTLCNTFNHFEPLNLKMYQETLGINMLFVAFRETKKPNDERDIEARVVNLTNSRCDVYEVDGNIRVHGNSSTILLPSSVASTRSLKPYARRFDLYVLNYVKTWRITTQPAHPLPACGRSYAYPAVLFSSGGYGGNQFHDFTDLLIPLFLTSRQFNGSVIFLLTNKRYPWPSKYDEILHNLSKYEIINVDAEQEVLCFPRIIAGLRSHKEMGIDPQQFPHYSMRDFRHFLRTTYSLERSSISDSPRSIRPRLLIISRKGSRVLKNEEQVAELARTTGFDVVMTEIDSNKTSRVARFINSFDVILGIHGAGLTNMVYLPDGALVVEIVPFGVEGLAKPCFQIPSTDMNLRHIEYIVSLNESSLEGKYPADSEVYRHPGEILKRGFSDFRTFYLDNQDVTLDLGRFRRILSRAMNFTVRG